ncbi:MAG: hypothetical protein Q8P78_00275 [bacterium]|nr:hypothetical protein [bacterium]
MSAWSFAIVNGRLAEVHFDDRKRIYGHCYVVREEYKTKQELRWIDEDTKRLRIVYRNKKYKQVKKIKNGKLALVKHLKIAHFDTSKKNMSPAFDTAEDLIAWLNRDRKAKTR